jgi:hypothetical protein
MKIIFVALLVAFSSVVSAQKLEERPLGDIQPAVVNDVRVVQAAKPASAPVPKTPNSVAVTDLSFKKEVQEFFYDEKFNYKSNLQTSNASVSVGDDKSAQFPSINANAEASYSKQFGTKRVVSYSEVRGLNADIKRSLISAGYKVIQPAPNVAAKENEDDSFFSLKKRILNGDFHDAEFVLHGTVVSVDSRATTDHIQGTSDFSYKLENAIIAEFTLVNTETMQVAASFTAMGSGQDMYLGKANVNYVPNMNRINKDLLSSFSQDAQKKLLDQLPPVKKEGFFSNIFSSKDEGAVGDPSTLKVYAPSKSGEKVAPEVKDPVTIYKK